MRGTGNFSNTTKGAATSTTNKNSSTNSSQNQNTKFNANKTTKISTQQSLLSSTLTTARTNSNTLASPKSQVTIQQLITNQSKVGSMASKTIKPILRGTKEGESLTSSLALKKSKSGGGTTLSSSQNSSNNNNNQRYNSKTNNDKNTNESAGSSVTRKSAVKGQTFTYVQKSVEKKSILSPKSLSGRNSSLKSPMQVKFEVEYLDQSAIHELEAEHTINQSQNPSSSSEIVNFQVQLPQTQQNSKKMNQDQQENNLGQDQQDEEQDMESHRTSDEVKYKELVGSQNIDQDDNNNLVIQSNPNMFDGYQYTSGDQQSISRPLQNSSSKSKATSEMVNQINAQYNFNYTQSSDHLSKEQFVVIKEDQNNTNNNNYGVRQTQKEGAASTKSPFTPNNDRQPYNSDFKRFTMEDEVQSEPQLRLHKKAVVDQKDINFVFQTETSDGDNDIEGQNEQNLEDTPQGFKQKKEYKFGIFEQVQIQSQANLKNNQDNLESNKRDAMITQKEQSATVNQSNQNHILSFADNNTPNMEQYQIQPNQIRKTNEENGRNEKINERDQFSEDSEFTSPQQRFKDNNSQILEALQLSNIDEAHLNTIIENEKNYVISQYETILQQLNQEFHKIMQKNKELEEIIIKKDETVRSYEEAIQNKDSYIQQQTQQNHQLASHVKQLVQELENTTKQLICNTQYAKEVESLRHENNTLESNIASMQGALQQKQYQILDSNQKVEHLEKQQQHQEQQIRRKDEEIFSLRKEVQALSSEIRNVTNIEKVLRDETNQIQEKRSKLENEVQNTNTAFFKQQIKLKELETEVDNIIRDNKALMGTLEVLQASYNNTLTENIKLKETITQAESQKISIRQMFEKQNREIHNGQIDVQNLQQQLEQANLSRKDLESQLRVDMRNMKDQYLQEINFLKQQLQKKEIAQQQEYNFSSNEDSQYFKPSGHQNANLNRTVNFQSNDYQKHNSLDEQDNERGFYSPQQQKNSFAQSFKKPQQEFSNNQLKSQLSLQWPSSTQAQESQKPRQSSQANEQSPFNARSSAAYDYSSLHNPSKSINNQSNAANNNRWPNPQQQRGQNIISWTGNQDSQNFYHEKVNHRPQYSKSQDRYSATANGSSQNGDGSLQIQHQEQRHSVLSANKVNTNNHNNLNWWNHNNQAQDKKENNQEKGQQAAGKKSNFDPSPLVKKDVNHQQHIQHLQNSLSALQMDKERLENEQRKSGGHPKNKQQIHKKQEMEMEVEIVNKNIQNLKSKLREMNAF